MDETLERAARRGAIVVLLIAAAIYLAGILSPPSLMDDVDAVQAQIGANMLESGDWVTARLNGVKYLEKSPLKYWLIASSFAVFGVNDTAARIPIALSILLLVWVTLQFGTWAFGARAGFHAGLVLTTCVGLFLFTRILIPDVILTLTITVAMWSFLRALEPEEPRPRLWAALLAAAIGTGLLLKGLIAALFPIGGALVYLWITKQLFDRAVWRKLEVPMGVAIAGGIALPWHIAATLANPPYFDFTPRSVPGEYHGFFWFYFLNEHVFRFLNMRHPRDYNTVPRHLFWLFHLLWLFPWSPWLVEARKLGFDAATRAGRARLLCLCWTGFLLVFFTFSTTQEYYSMPCYPALALLTGCVLAGGEPARWPVRVVQTVCGLALSAILFLLSQVWTLPTPGDISQALRVQAMSAYTLSLGHLGDLTIPAFAYLRLPLMIAGAAFLLGLFAAARPVALALMMVLFFHAARLAMVTFDPVLASRALAETLRAAPPGRVIIDNQYYTFSSVFFYGRVKNALLLNGRVNNLEYGSHEPGAPQVFIRDGDFAAVWRSPARHYLLVEGPSVGRIQRLVGPGELVEVRSAGGKTLFTNQALR